MPNYTESKITNQGLCNLSQILLQLAEFLPFAKLSLCFVLLLGRIFEENFNAILIKSKFANSNNAHQRNPEYETIQG